MGYMIKSGRFVALVDFAHLLSERSFAHTCLYSTRQKLPTQIQWATFARGVSDTKSILLELVVVWESPTANSCRTALSLFLKGLNLELLLK